MDVSAPAPQNNRTPRKQLTVLTRAQSISTYSYASFAWLATQGVPLILWPSFISSLLGEEYHQSNRAAPCPSPAPVRSAPP